jgi:hypothetical protein
MGYTHYWHRPETLDPRRFSRFRQDVARLLTHLPERTGSAGGYYRDDDLIVRGPDGMGDPVITDELVSFNGNAPLAGDAEADDFSHETFHIPRVYQPQDWQQPDGQGRYFDFCKTARKPYDLTVTAALIALNHYFPNPDVALSSDGTAEDWEPGLALCRAVLGYGNLPVEVESKRRESQPETDAAEDRHISLLTEAMQAFPRPRGANLNSTATQDERSHFISAVIGWWNRYGVEADQLGLIDHRQNPKA